MVQLSFGKPTVNPDTISLILFTISFPDGASPTIITSLTAVHLFLHSSSIVRYPQRAPVGESNLRNKSHFTILSESALPCQMT